MIPEIWMKYNTESLRLALRHVNKYKHLLKWKENESILEIGCGDGTNAKQVILPILPKDYKEFHVSEKEPDFVKYIQRNVIIPKLEVFKQDIVDDEVPKELENRFDHIFGFFVLHMLMEPRKALENIHKMLKPGGQTFLNFFEYTPVDNVMKKMDRHPKWGKYPHAMNAYINHENPLEAYTKDFIAAGFENAIYNTEIETCEFEDPYWRDLFLSVNPTVSKIPENEKEDYFKDFLEACSITASPPVKKPDGKLVREFPTKLFVVVADRT
ncbi:juvenile hormone acid O-methyltransferase-like [Diorhabda sublineata]|uniref:juvenile hormone acid O-methyltransferase-like n=1 Tax=Diorhabda sublineata TaxID=1163346 RepID=UPI0024E1728F|nr:juvenile hormone acid O-methyltransferase-like [Diorhabda sublineata]